MTDQPKMKVLIIGAGIAGLTSGIMLRDFMDVTILETASELKEVGAAVVLGSSAAQRLAHHGIDLIQAGGIINEHRTIWKSSGQQTSKTVTNPEGKPDGHHTSIHRVDLQSALLKAATTTDSPGKPCTILLNHRVVHVDTESGEVKVADGSSFQADVVIGADGIRSNVRSFIVGDSYTAKPSGDNAYRFMLRADDLQAINSPLLKDGKIIPDMHVVLGPQRKLIFYPCRGGAVLNCGAFVPDSELHEVASDKWMVEGDHNALIESYKDFDSKWTDIIKIAKDVGLWQMRDLEPLPTWVKGRMILIGDAAHAMLPHRGAGAMSAIEDAEALSVFLRGVSPGAGSINEALQHVFRVRYRRASLCQAESHAAGLGAKSNSRANTATDLWIYSGAARWEVERPDMILPAV